MNKQSKKRKMRERINVEEQQWEKCMQEQNRIKPMTRCVF